MKDIIGCEVFSTSGDALGRVVDVYETPSTDVYVIKGAKRLSVPALKNCFQALISKTSGLFLIPKFLRRLDCLRIDILTIFPEMFSNILSSSILGRAASKGILEFKTHNIRDFSQNKHRNTDDYPFGGGAGMVMLAQPIFDCIESVAAEAPEKPRCIVMSPRGRVLTPALAKELASEKRLLSLRGIMKALTNAYRNLSMMKFQSATMF